MVDPVLLHYDPSDARDEDLDDYGSLDKGRFADRVRRISYLNGIRRLQHALGATVFSSLSEIQSSAAGIVIGGGMTMIRAVRENLERIVDCHRLETLHVDYSFRGLGGLPLGSLLGVASGCALAGTKRFLRQGTLSCTLGVGPIFWQLSNPDEPEQGALELLAADNVVIPDSEERLNAWLAENCAVTAPFGPDGSLITGLPIYRVLAVRGCEIPEGEPLRIPLDGRYLFFGHPLYLVQFLDSERLTAGTLSDVRALAQVSASSNANETLGIELEIERNEVWSLRIIGADGEVMVSANNCDVQLMPLSREAAEELGHSG
jgi:hypothetical protein